MMLRVGGCYERCRGGRLGKGVDVRSVMLSWDVRQRDVEERFVGESLFFFFEQKTADEMLRSLVGSEMCIRDRRSWMQYGVRGLWVP